jgi:hypothetical protein
MCQTLPCLFWRGHQPPRRPPHTRFERRVADCAAELSGLRRIGRKSPAEMRELAPRLSESGLTPMVVGSNVFIPVPNQLASNTAASCPVCALVKGQLLDCSSKLACADIFQCGSCGRVWAVPTPHAT